MDIIEDYVSLEVAKLLKEKGFNEATNRYYNAQCDEIRTVSDIFMFHWNNEDYMKVLMMEGAIAIPTLQMACKWLREVHNKHCDIGYDIDLEWFFQIIDLKATVEYDYPEIKFYHAKNEFGFKTYEEAVEAAIKYVLENLI